MAYPKARTINNTRQRRRQHAILYITFACLPLLSGADMPGACTDAAGKLLSSLANEQPDNFSEATCALAPPSIVCEIRGEPRSCSDTPECAEENTRIDESCTPMRAANTCCSTFWALPCAGCDSIPIACIQFCVDEPVFGVSPPDESASGNTSTTEAPPAPPPDEAPMPAQVEDPDPDDEAGIDADSALPPAVAADTSEGVEVGLTPTGLPQQIIVESISGAAAVPGVAAVACTAAAAVTAALAAAW